MASRSLLDDVLTVRRMDCGDRDDGPRETVAVEAFSEAVRRDRDVLPGATSIKAPAALTAAERWLRRDDMSRSGADDQMK